MYMYMYMHVVSRKASVTIPIVRTGKAKYVSIVKFGESGLIEREREREREYGNHY